MASRRKKQLCIYCGQRLANSRDHVPPKELFPRPRPSDLITVPACKDCDRAASKDEQYFGVLVSSLLDTVQRSQSARKTLEGPVRRALERSAGLRGLLLSHSRKVDVLTEAGIYLGQSLVARPDIQRLEGVVCKITKGLYYHHREERLPDTCGVVALVNVDDAAFQLPPLDRSKPTLVRRIGGDVFAYAMFAMVDGPCETVWVMTFYRGFNALAVTSSRADELAKRKETLTRIMRE